MGAGSHNAAAPCLESSLYYAAGLKASLAGSGFFSLNECFYFFKKRRGFNFAFAEDYIFVNKGIERTPDHVVMLPLDVEVM
ncbi:hypothetical protein chiPu_0011093 [Chiloscyllium punctatum]|uniref:Uncharacterized protein n=1 Tax=Chiloscyllium punctatum TaxID=137246 RepID=A0A401SQG1_CHIPU|nr:hypothetical protein [Chiloscyllium punctatum]